MGKWCRKWKAYYRSEKIIRRFRFLLISAGEKGECQGWPRIIFSSNYANYRGVGVSPATNVDTVIYSRPTSNVGGPLTFNSNRARLRYQPVLPISRIRRSWWVCHALKCSHSNFAEEPASLYLLLAYSSLRSLAIRVSLYLLGYSTDVHGQRQ